MYLNLFRSICLLYTSDAADEEDSVEASTKSQDELSDNLDEWEENTKNVFKGNIKSELDSVLLDTIEKYPQSIQPYLDMIDVQRMDLNKFRYKDFDELKLYCYRVAGTVGLMTQNVMGLSLIHI